MSDSKIRTLIVDDNMEFSNILNEYLGAEDDFEITGIASDGIQALDLFKNKSPDLMILDIIMPYLDGIGVLESIHKENLKGKCTIVVLSAIGHDNITQKAIQLGADYYIVKPFDISVFAGRLRELFFEDNIANLQSSEAGVYAKKATGIDDIETEVSYTLHELGVPANVKGYQYLRDAILMVIDNLSLISAVTKELYPTIAEKYNTTASRAERAIRHAIEVASERGGSDNPNTNTLFASTFTTAKSKPSNSEFIAIVADSIRLKLKDN